MDKSFQIINNTNCKNVECLVCASAIFHTLIMLTHLISQVDIVIYPYFIEEEPEAWKD